MPDVKIYKYCQNPKVNIADNWFNNAPGTNNIGAVLEQSIHGHLGESQALVVPLIETKYY